MSPSDFDAAGNIAVFAMILVFCALLWYYGFYGSCSDVRYFEPLKPQQQSPEAQARKKAEEEYDQQWSIDMPPLEDVTVAAQAEKEKSEWT